MFGRLGTRGDGVFGKTYSTANVRLDTRDDAFRSQS
jgi:hypothetical protein